MIEKKELLIYTSGKPNYSSDYSCLWEQIASKFNFIRISYENKESKPSEKNIIDQINTKYTNIYYSSKPDYKIIWDAPNEYILINKPWEYGKIFVIPDYSIPYRYFIGFEYKSGYTTNQVAGMIIYFDLQGNMISTKTKIIPYGLTTNYDVRDGSINSSKSSFYKQTLIFTLSHRDKNNLITNINLLDFDDHIICQSSDFTQLKTIWGDYTNVQTMLKYPRFFHFVGYSSETENKQINVIIDLGSLKMLKNHIKHYTQVYGSIYKNDPSDYLSLDYYISDDKQDNLEEFFERANLYESEEFNDGYPDNCVICLKKTTEATYGYNNICMGLGNSFCLDCQIRYSKSDKAWKCCKLEKGYKDDDINLCSNKLSSSNNYMCINPYHLEKYRLNTVDSNSNKLKSNFKEMLDGVISGIIDYVGVFEKKKIHVSPYEIK